jgi:hypothetical protein
MLLPLWLLGFSASGGSSDTTPDQFTFTDVSNQPINTVITSDPVTITGIDAASAITVSGGTYSINGGAYTASAGTAVLNDVVRARHTSSASELTVVSTIVTIGGVSDTFSSRTLSTTPPSGGIFKKFRRRFFKFIGR